MSLDTERPGSYLPCRLRTPDHRDSQPHRWGSTSCHHRRRHFLRHHQNENEFQNHELHEPGRWRGRPCLPRCALHESQAPPSCYLSAWFRCETTKQLRELRQPLPPLRLLARDSSMLLLPFHGLVRETDCMSEGPACCTSASTGGHRRCERLVPQPLRSSPQRRAPYLVLGYSSPP